MTVGGAFQHRKCNRISMPMELFQYLTCSMCAEIPLENNFRMRVRREDQALVKRGHCSTTNGIRLGYLFALEVSMHTRFVSKNLRLENLHHWHARVHIVQLKVRRPTLCESTMQALFDKNLMKFCNNIINAHRIGTFGGKDALWDFLKELNFDF